MTTVAVVGTGRMGSAMARALARAGHAVILQNRTRDRCVPLARVGVRELRDNLSRYDRRVAEGESVVITDHGKPVGELRPAAQGRTAEQARQLVRKGVASWSGGKPKGLACAPRPRAALVSDAVIEDRR